MLLLEYHYIIVREVINLGRNSICPATI